MIDTVCPACSRRLKLPDTAAGKRGRCPACKNMFTVPHGTNAPNAVARNNDPPAAVAKAPKDPPSRDREAKPKPKDPGKKGQRKSSQKPTKRPVWLFAAIGGAALVLGLCLISGIAGIFFLLPVGGKRQGPGGGGGQGASGGGSQATGGGGNPVAGADLAREPQPGPDSWVPTVAPDSAKPDQWKVTADPPAPRPGELKSF